MVILDLYFIFIPYISILKLIWYELIWIIVEKWKEELF